MRAKDDQRPGVELKRDVLSHFEEGSISFAMDDDDAIVAMYRQAGVTCLQPRTKVC